MKRVCIINIHMYNKHSSYKLEFYEKLNYSSCRWGNNGLLISVPNIEENNCCLLIYIQYYIFKVI